MASEDARIIPLKNTAYRVTFPIMDNDGDLVSDADGLDSQVSQDGGAFAACTNEATQIASQSGMYFLDLTATEMDANTVVVICKTSTTDAKTTPIVLYPDKGGDVRADVRHWRGAAVPEPSQDGVPEVDVTHHDGVVTNISTLTAANVESECNDALVALHLDHLLAVDYDPSSKPGASTALLNEIIENDSGVSRFTQNALEQGPDTDHTGTGSSLSAIPWNAAWDAEVESEVLDALDEPIPGTPESNSINERIAALDDIQTDTSDIKGRLPTALVGGRMDSNASAIDGNATAATNLRDGALGIVRGEASGTPTQTVIETNLSEANDNHYNGRILIFIDGDVAGQATDITGYDGTTNELTVTELTDAPSGGDAFVIV